MGVYAVLLIPIRLEFELSEQYGFVENQDFAIALPKLAKQSGRGGQQDHVIATDDEFRRNSSGSSPLSR